MDVTKYFLSGIKDCNEFYEAVDIVKDNSVGKIWLIGGFVCRTITSQLYGIPRPEVDLDFIIEKPTLKITFPKGWIVSKNRYGNPKLVYGSKQIDYIPLNNIHSLLQRKIRPTINNFLTGVPLNIQSIAYDVYNNKIVGDIGISAIQKQAVEVNNLCFAKYAAKMKGITLNEMIKEKAESLGFEPIYPH